MLSACCDTFPRCRSRNCRVSVFWSGTAGDSRASSSCFRQFSGCGISGERTRHDGRAGTAGTALYTPAASQCGSAVSSRGHEPDPIGTGLILIPQTRPSCPATHSQAQPGEALTLQDAKDVSVHGHRHHGGRQVLQVASQRLAQGVHIKGLQVTQGPICQGTDFPWVAGTAPGTQPAPLVLPAPIPETITHHPASYHGTQAAHMTKNAWKCPLHPRNKLALGSHAGPPWGGGRGHFRCPHPLP